MFVYVFCTLPPANEHFFIYVATIGAYLVEIQKDRAPAVEVVRPSSTGACF